MQKLSAEQVASYHSDGYILVPGFFDAAEISPCVAAIKSDPTIGGRMQVVHDGVDETKNDQDSYRFDYLGWFQEGDDWLGACTRLERIVLGAATLIGEEVYHYHSKLVKKPNINSGSLVWHQDYGGWYQDGCLSPEMLTFVLAITDADETSGCLRVLKGSHHIGRVDRVRNEHAYANIHPRRLDSMLERFEEVAIEMNAGDGLFFHGNLVHSSGPNRANYDRLLLELSYNGISNAPVFENQSHHAARPLQVVADSEFRQRQFNGFTDVFGDTPLQDLSDRNAEGASIYYRDSFPDLS